MYPTYMKTRDDGSIADWSLNFEEFEDHASCDGAIGER